MLSTFGRWPSLRSLSRFKPTTRPQYRTVTSFLLGPRIQPPSRSYLAQALSRGLASVATARSPISSPQNMESRTGSFDLLQEVKIDNADIVVSKWRSRKSGLSVVHLDYDAPIVKGYFVVPTEIFDDSGCPHTLEHLVFLGSEKYPYKGVLDQLANRAFAEGTNAWTDTDNTTYTIATAGQQGFLQLLPIYVDHILYPTITDAGFTTEVHHVNGEGEDAGVVYSEMQGRENTSGDLMALRSQQLLYLPTSAYRSETGGLMEALRVLTADKIRQYHGTYYVPHNICLIVAGKLSTKDLLHTIETTIEPRIVEHGQAKGPRPAGWKRPFVETPSAENVVLKVTKEETVEFPEKDESVGEVLLTFIGPPANAYLENKAIDILGIYLTDSPVSPLYKEFVEIPSPLCTYIYFAENTRASFLTLDVYLGGVPTEHLDTIAIKLKEALERIIKNGFDMDRMATVLRRERLKLSDQLESAGGDYFKHAIISDHLYGREDGQDLKAALSEAQHLDLLKTWSKDQWAHLLRRYTDAGSVVIRGKPSTQLADRLEADEKARVASQREKLGPEGLEKLEKQVEEAKKENDRPIPSEILKSFPVPDVGSISWIPVQSVRNDKGHLVTPGPSSKELEKHIGEDKSILPYFVQFDNGKSDFVTVTAWLSTAALPNGLRPYLYIYLSSFFSLPVERADGTKLSHEEVVKQLDQDTIAYDASLGADSYFEQLVKISLKVETSKYSEGIAWLRDLIYSAEFDKERITVNIAKTLQTLPEMKRDGNGVVYSVSGGLLLSDASNRQASAITTLMDFIPSLAKQMEENPEAVIKDFKAIRESITKPDGVRFSVKGNVLGLKSPRSDWAKHFRSFEKQDLQPIQWSKDTLTHLGRKPAKKGVVVSLPTIESSFGLHSTKTITGFDHPDLPALRLACEVLDGTESFFWRSIRGAGLAYGANMSIDVETGLLSFSLYRSPNSFKGFEEARKVVKGLVDGSIDLDDTALDAAKSTIVYSIAKQVSTVGRAASDSFNSQVLKNVPHDYGRQLLQKIQSVNLSEVKESLRKYVLPLFDPSTSVAVVVSAPSKTDEIAQGLESVGFTVEKRTIEVSPDELGSDGTGSDGSEDESDSSGR